MSPLKKRPGEGTEFTRRADLLGNLVGLMPPRGEPCVFQPVANPSQKGSCWDAPSPSPPESSLRRPSHSPRPSPPYLFSVAQIANLPYRRLQIGRALAVFRRPAQGVVLQDGILRYSAARPSRNQNGPRLWSKTQPQRVGIAAMLRLVLL